MSNNHQQIWVTPISEYFLSDISVEKCLISNLHNCVEFKDWEGVEPFFDWLRSCVSEYVSNNFNIKTSIEIQRAWFNELRPLECTPVHSHGNVDVVGVYYFNLEENADNSDLILYDPRPPHRFNEVVVKDGNNNTLDCARQINISAKNHKLVLYPGYLLHSVQTNLTDVSRYSIAINFKVAR